MTTGHSTHDLSLRAVFARALRLERQYALRLRSIARIVDHMVRGYDLTDHLQLEELQRMLRNYGRALEPWARSVAARMIAEVAQRDERSWFAVSRLMGRSIREEIAGAGLGAVVRTRLSDQVRLITSLPTEAAERVRTIATEARASGMRPAEMAAKIMETGDVTKARAMLIARTETSRTATELTRARAEYVGSTHFVWRTAEDVNVRRSHRELNGTVHRWDQPPICDPPDHRALPGGIWNCRCYPEPILPERG